MSKNNINDIPNTFDCFNSVLGYSYRLHMWIWDVKFYLVDNNWCFDPEGENIIRQIDERELKEIEKYKHFIEEHEKENISWTNHKQCRKRSCVCKKCKKYCHCYDCKNRISECDI